MKLFLLAILVLTSGCGDTLGHQVELALTASGNGASFAQGGFQVTLERAEVAFGPLYLCPASVPSDKLCETAVAELKGTVTIDGLDEAPQTLRPLIGTTGTIRSAVFDYGISWPLTFRSPQPAPEAPGGHSARFEGSATDGTRTLLFSADIDIVANAVGRLTSGTVTEHTIENAESRLHLVLEPARLWRGVDFESLAESAFADVDPNDVTASVHIEPGTPSYEAIVHEISAGRGPRFEWSHSSE